MRAIRGYICRTATSNCAAASGSMLLRDAARYSSVTPSTMRTSARPRTDSDLASPGLAPPDLTVHGPEVFYPLGPEMSRHWFHLRAGRARDLQRVLLPETRVVHWYSSADSGRVTARIDPAYVRDNAERQLFSALALPFVSA